MMGDVVELPVITSLDIPVERVLARAAERDLKRVVVVGEDQDGNEFFASSVGGGPDVVWMFERAKHKLIKMADGGDE